jgi:hypothetical protein
VILFSSEPPFDLLPFQVIQVGPRRENRILPTPLFIHTFDSISAKLPLQVRIEIQYDIWSPFTMIAMPSLPGDDSFFLYNIPHSTHSTGALGQADPSEPSEPMYGDAECCSAKKYRKVKN